MAKYPSIRLIFDRNNRSSKTKLGLIQLEVYHNGKRRWYSTNIKVYKDQWDDRYMVINSPYQYEYNQIITSLLREAQAYIANCANNGEEFSYTSFAALFNPKVHNISFLDYMYKEILKDKAIRETTRKQHIAAYNTLSKYEHIVEFSDLTLANIKAFDDYLHTKGYKQTSVYGIHKRIKKYINNAVRADIIAANPYDKMKLDRGKFSGIKYLLKEEIDMLEHCSITDNYISKARDLFIFQCYTGLSYSDMAKFDWDKVDKHKDYYAIIDCRQKTDEQYFIVLLKPAIRVLQRYNYQLPIISNAKYNAYLKIVAKYAGLSKPITSHYARHSYAVMALSMGVKMEHISKMLGHTSIRTTEQTYAKVLPKDIIADFKNIDKQL